MNRLPLFSVRPLLRTCAVVCLLLAAILILGASPVQSQTVSSGAEIAVEGTCSESLLATRGVSLDVRDLIGEDALCSGLAELLQTKPPHLFAGTSYAVASTQTYKEWALISLHTLENGPDGLAVGKTANVLAWSSRNGRHWRLGLEGTPEFSNLLAQVPTDWIPEENKVFLDPLHPGFGVLSTNSTEYKFPWPAGDWQYWNGFNHDSTGPTAVDVGWSGNASAERRVLAAAGGVVSYICDNPSNESANVIIIHDDGREIKYFHIDRATLRDGIRAGNRVERGRVLGVLKAGTWNWDGCGATDQTTTSAHLHWILPSDAITVDGWTIDFPDSTWRRNGDTRSPGYPYDLLTSTNTPNEGGGGDSCSAPSLTEPSNNATLATRTITFKWNSVSGCQFNGYTFRICSFSPVSIIFNCFVDEFVSGTQRTHTISNHDNMDLYWGVTAANAPNGAAWAERKFRIDPDGGGTGDTCSSNEAPAHDEVILFDEPSYGEGPCAKLRVGEYDNLGEYSMDKKTSSVRVGSDVDVTLFTELDFDGDSETFENDHGNLDDNSDVGKNEARSAKVTWENDDPGGNCSNPGPSQAVLFDGEDYENACIVLEVGLYPNFHNLSPDLNDLVSSIKTGSKVKLKLYEHSDYRGDDSTFGPGSSDEDLSNNTIGKNEASSAKIYYPLSTPPAVYDIDNGDGDGAFVVAWTSVQYAEHYDVYEQPPGGGWAMIAEDQPNLSREFSGKSAGTWCYKVRAGHFGENSAESAPKCTIVNSPPTPPDTPLLMDISNPEADGLYIVQWQAAARATSYELQEKAESSDWTVIYTGPELSAGRNDKPAGQWCYRVKAIGLGGESGWSSEKCTVVQPPPVCVPGANGIILYEDPNYAGRCITLTADDDDLIDNTFDDLVSSVQFVGTYANAGWQISLFADSGFVGPFSNLRFDDPDLGNNTPVRGDQVSSIRMWRDSDDGRMVTLGRPVNGTIHVASDLDWYRFQGTAGQTVTITMDTQGGSALDPYIVLYGPAWAKLAFDDDSGGNSNARILNYRLWTTGTYHIFAQSFSGGSEGAYQLTVNGAQCVPAANGVVLYTGVNYTGSCITLTADEPHLGNRGFNDTISSLRFVGNYANSGHQISLFADSNFSGAVANFFTDDPDLGNNIGNRVASSFRVWHDVDDGRQISWWQTHYGTIDVTSDFDTYWFYGTIGQHVTIRMNKEEAGLDPYLTLFGPQWGVLKQDDDSGGDNDAFIYNFRLWTTGTYRIYARSFDRSSSGSYHIDLTPGP